MCKAIREGDEMACSCGLRWGIDEVDPHAAIAKKKSNKKVLIGKLNTAVWTLPSGVVCDGDDVYDLVEDNRELIAELLEHVK